jgi:hypothetical protein
MGSQKPALATLLAMIATTVSYGVQVGTIYGCYACQNSGNNAIEAYLASGAGGPAVAASFRSTLEWTIRLLFRRSLRAARLSWFPV